MRKLPNVSEFSRGFYWQYCVTLKGIRESYYVTSKPTFKIFIKLK